MAVNTVLMANRYLALGTWQQQIETLLYDISTCVYACTLYNSNDGCNKWPFTCVMDRLFPIVLCKMSL
jgi:hypothetical protein